MSWAIGKKKVVQIQETEEKEFTERKNTWQTQTASNVGEFLKDYEHSGSIKRRGEPITPSVEWREYASYITFRELPVKVRFRERRLL